ncbi:hypothetical protein ACLOJK_006118 [Asimina triloba]
MINRFLDLRATTVTCRSKRNAFTLHSLIHCKAVEPSSPVTYRHFLWQDLIPKPVMPRHNISSLSKDRPSESCGEVAVVGWFPYTNVQVTTPTDFSLDNFFHYLIPHEMKVMHIFDFDKT